ncbi:MAG: hypothetical protein A2V45_09300 [Candidatus Aminicenantes bacterium RBG_19FT_COMBO_58_17]|nr:MAG: hypothetical protein A2V45_09300 [Candidatus Aminicenantes bacterium RBG_19FT_COMBO_58_17]
MNMFRMPLVLILVVVILAVIFVSFVLFGEGKIKYRSEVLKALARAETMFNQSPGNPASRQEYATLLFQTGDFWKAKMIVQPLLEKPPEDLEILHLGARLAYLLADYKNAEEFYRRIMNLAGKGTKKYKDAAKGLALTYFQTRTYDKVKELPDIKESKAFVEMMKKFPGKPYTIEWANKERTTAVPYTIEGMLPTFEVRVNGKDLKFILDTGGNLFYIDKGVAKDVGLEKLATHKATYAYTGGQEVEEFLGRADSVTLGGVTIKNVPMTLAEWKSRGIESDGVLTTQALKEFLFTIDYRNGQMIFRERNELGLKLFKDSVEGKETVDIPFVLDETHLLFTRGSLNGTPNLTFLVDSGLAASASFVGMDGMLEDLKIETTKIEGSKYRLFTISSLGLGSLVWDKPAQGLAGIMVGEPPYWSQGFIWDGLISHQFLKNFGSWTIDFDGMKFIFTK